MTKITRGSGNVFADIGLPDPETHLVKAELVRQIGEAILSKKLTQAEAAQQMGMSQPDVSKMLTGHFRPISIERLIRCLVLLGMSVTIDVAPPAAKRARAGIRVRRAAGSKRLAAR
jgi:predicted XRE-type DNA-binding protein